MKCAMYLSACTTKIDNYVCTYVYDWLCKNVCIFYTNSCKILKVAPMFKLFVKLQYKEQL